MGTEAGRTGPAADEEAPAAAARNAFGLACFPCSSSFLRRSAAAVRKRSVEESTAWAAGQRAG